jgi:hypothetical protein
VGIQLELAGQGTDSVFGHVHRQNLAGYERHEAKAFLRLRCHDDKVGEIQLF